MEDFAYCETLSQILGQSSIPLPDGSDIPFLGGSTPNNLRILRYLVEIEKAEETLEIGLAYGVSALCLLSSLRDFSESDQFHHTAIDPFQSSDFQSAAVSLIEAEGLGSHFSLIEQASALALAKMIEQGKQFDVIYVDGSHLFEDVFIDFYFGTQLLKTGGVMIFDDCTNPHVRKLIRFIMRNYQECLARESIPSSVVHQDWKRKIAKRLDWQQAKAFRKIADPPRNWDAGLRSF